MRRREFVGLISGAVAWPLAARAQQQGLPIIGCIDPGIRETGPEEFTAFQNGLNGIGYYDGQKLAIEYRWAEDEYERLPLYAAELVQIQVQVSVATGGPVA